jgi:hypothetical protein
MTGATIHRLPVCRECSNPLHVDPKIKKWRSWPQAIKYALKVEGWLDHWCHDCQLKDPISILRSKYEGTSNAYVTSRI